SRRSAAAVSSRTDRRTTVTHCSPNRSRARLPAPPTRSSTPRRGWRRSPSEAALEFHADVLDLGVAGERLETLPASVAALLVAAERQLDAPAGAVRVHVDLAGLEARRDRHRLVDVARPDPGDEAVLAHVADADRLLDVVKRDDGQDRTEDLFL